MLNAQGIDVRQNRVSAAIEVSWQDMRHGLRQLRRSPGFAAIAILTLALGIGANTAIFSFVNAVLLRPLPYPNANRLAIIWSGVGDTNRAPASSFELFQIRQHTKQFDQVAGIWVTNGALPRLSEAEHVAEQVKVGVVTSNFLPLFCTKPMLGRFFLSQDEASNATQALIISYGVWVQRFGSNPSIIGRSTRFGRESAVVVGVLPENFRLILPADSSVPLNVDIFRPIPIYASDPQGPAFLHLVGRLRNGSNVARAQAEADAIATHIHTFDGRSGISNFRLSVVGLQADDVRAVRYTLLLLFGGVTFVLLIGCANVANLLMARARQRLRETITRAALGASSARLVRQLLTESLLLASIGALSALPISWVAVRALLAVRPPSFVNFNDVRLDGKVLAFTFVVAILTSLMFGLAPVLSVRRLDLARNLREAGRTAGSNKRHWARVLVATEVALAFVLLLGTGLLMRTFVNLLQAQPGFRAENVFTFPISGSSYQMLRQLRQNLAAIPGVQSVAAVSHLPLDDAGNWYDTYWKEGAPVEAQNTDTADLRCILPGYFRTIGATLLSGRDFTESDDTAHEHVAIVDDVLARQLWPHGDAIGQKLNVSDSPKGPYEFQRDWLVVVGVVRHVQYHSLAAIVRPQIYMPFQLAPRPTMAMVIHTAGAVADLPASARKQVGLLNKDVAVSHVAPLSELVARALSESRFASLLASLLSGIAVLLACIGVYGLLSYLAAQRTSEIGIRMAMGAQRAQVIAMVLADGLSAVLLGITGGFLLSLVVMPLLGSLLFGVRPGSPANYALILVLVLVLSVFAAFLPARRAMNIDPLMALRYE
jgi:predicted permease